MPTKSIEAPGILSQLIPGESIPALLGNEVVQLGLIAIVMTTIVSRMFGRSTR